MRAVSPEMLDLKPRTIPFSQLLDDVLSQPCARLTGKTLAERLQGDCPKAIPSHCKAPRPSHRIAPHVVPVRVRFLSTGPEGRSRRCLQDGT